MNDYTLCVEDNRLAIGEDANGMCRQEVVRTSETNGGCFSSVVVSDKSGANICIFLLKHSNLHNA